MAIQHRVLNARVARDDWYQRPYHRREWFGTVKDEHNVNKPRDLLPCLHPLPEAFLVTSFHP